jgi:enamine deaminase RidA (YjgF/YER057c/UK114 family)
MPTLHRVVTTPRYADIVIHGDTAYWVEIAEDTSLDARGQIGQILAQIDATLATIGSDRTRLIQIVIHLADLADAATLDELWDAWVPQGHPPVRARVQSGLGGTCLVEMLVTAAVTPPETAPTLSDPIS